MNCEEAGEWFAVYRDLPENSEQRLVIDEHVASCGDCAEEFRIWEESALLIQELSSENTEHEDPIATEWVSHNVMNRIYAEQSWYMPAVRRTYSFSFAFRRKVAGLLAALLALFVCGLLYTLFDRASSVNDHSGVMETANAFAISHQVGDGVHLDVPIASLSDPIMLNVSPAMPEYWIALSMLGTIMMLLILNWFSRVRT
jgi:hypothetical protein